MKTLRDEFAGLAMQALLANPVVEQAFKEYAPDGTEFGSWLAAQAYSYAQKMIEVRDLTKAQLEKAAMRKDERDGQPEEAEG